MASIYDESLKEDVSIPCVVFYNDVNGEWMVVGNSALEVEAMEAAHRDVENRPVRRILVHVPKSAADIPDLPDVKA